MLTRQRRGLPAFPFSLTLNKLLKMEYTSNRVDKITNYVEALKADEQQQLLDALERKALLEEARRLNKSVRKNTISIKEICDMVNDVRKKRKRK